MLTLVADALTEAWLEELAPASRSLRHHYRPGRDRREVYRAMVDEILAPVRSGKRVCALFYGHPGVFAVVGHDAVRQARAEGLAAKMLPAVSAEDCLFADLGIDPGESGCQSFDATDFLLRRRRVDPSAALLLWQIGAIGMERWEPAPSTRALPILLEYLLEFYPESHEAVIYEASPFPVAGPLVTSIRLGELPGAKLSPLATLFVPPAESREPDPEITARLGLGASEVASDRASR